MVAPDKYFHRDGAKARSRRRCGSEAAHSEKSLARQTADILSARRRRDTSISPVFQNRPLLIDHCSLIIKRSADAYGNTLIVTAPGPDGLWFTDDDVQSDYGANEIIYCGYRCDPETQLYYVRNRTYNPVLGRWIQRDPIGYQDGPNIYIYAASNGVRFLDPSGLQYDPNALALIAGDPPLTMGNPASPSVGEMNKPCCEHGKSVPRVPVYVINRSGGVRTGITGGHIDMAISGVGLFGFYGYGPGPSGNRFGIDFHGYWNDTYAKFERNGLGRPDYVDGRAGELSTICVVMVCPSQVKKMARELHSLEKHPGLFNILGNNCSTHACEVLGAGGILERGIPGLDTPQNMQDALVRRYGARCFNGYTQLSPSNRLTIIRAGKAPPTPRVGGGSL